MSLMLKPAWARSTRMLWAAASYRSTLTRRMYSVNAEELLDKFAESNKTSTEQKRQAQMNKYSEKLLAKAKECVHKLTKTWNE